MHLQLTIVNMLIFIMMLNDGIYRNFNNCLDLARYNFSTNYSYTVNLKDNRVVFIQIKNDPPINYLYSNLFRGTRIISLVVISLQAIAT